MEGILRDGYFWPNSKWVGGDSDDDEYKVEDEGKTIKKTERDKNVCVQTDTVLCKGKYSKFAFTVRIRSSNPGTTVHYIGFYRKHGDCSEIRGDEQGSFSFNYLQAEKCDEGNESNYGRPIYSEERLTLFLDMATGRVHFMIEGEDQGQAFKDLELKKGSFYLSTDFFLENTVLELLSPEDAYFPPPKTEAFELGLDRILELSGDLDRNAIGLLNHLVKTSSKAGPVVQVLMQAIINNPVRFSEFAKSLVEESKLEDHDEVGEAATSQIGSISSDEILKQLIVLAYQPSMPSDFDQGKLAQNLKRKKDEVTTALVHLLLFSQEVEASSPSRPLLLKQVLDTFNLYPLPAKAADQPKKERKAAKIFNFKESLLGWKLKVFEEKLRGTCEQTEAAVLSTIVRPLLMLLKEAEEWEKANLAAIDETEAELDKFKTEFDDLL